MLSKVEAIDRINDLSSNHIPFLFISDFKSENNEVLIMEEIDPKQILYQINGYGNVSKVEDGEVSTQLIKSPMSFDAYQHKFDAVMGHLEKGNAYLLNLTCPTPVVGSCSLKDIFHQSTAKYKLWYKGQFVVFSPEIFVQIKDGQITSHPMKGTIDASIPNAENILLSSDKEMAEHATIVDLIRNDMSIHADHVMVEQFRYVDEIRTNHKHLLQVSSKITGQLKEGYQLGEVIFSLLPAGSITGAPKPRTLEIISEVEGYERGFYTGVVGYFDGNNFDSGVMIRFIEQQGEQWIYKSGGGIHSLSNAASEYQEMIDKVYVPIY
ncbi:aminodeoxychorismate synthase component I [Reichenbachiella agarivorans]|uniref:Aminodeoxychorismate synthase component I n=1 Tax=Reichenbachiella agarivorans TaxID=2979464 RepID=A0ABY6CKN5_9BACT|nr:aminodeoxychorismate synthase component I [Reichenbachiella agarivorans]UXP31086.1 aminodeoxychorismate synthase component I [Reichenbachiella agarivorans]